MVAKEHLLPNRVMIREEEQFLRARQLSNFTEEKAPRYSEQNICVSTSNKRNLRTCVLYVEPL